jgi:hypothetical protein
VSFSFRRPGDPNRDERLEETKGILLSFDIRDASSGFSCFSLLVLLSLVGWSNAVSALSSDILWSVMIQHYHSVLSSSAEEVA